MTIKINLNVEFEVTAENMSDLMVTALEGGINYWCRKARIISNPDEKAEYASDVIGVNGVLKLYDAESDDTWELNQEKFLKGLKRYMMENGYNSMEDLMDNHDADTADAIIQYAIFDEIMFG